MKPEESSSSEEGLATHPVAMGEMPSMQQLEQAAYGQQPTNPLEEMPKQLDTLSAQAEAVAKKMTVTSSPSAVASEVSKMPAPVPQSQPVPMIAPTQPMLGGVPQAKSHPLHDDTTGRVSLLEQRVVAQETMITQMRKEIESLKTMIQPLLVQRVDSRAAPSITVKLPKLHALRKETNIGIDSAIVSHIGHVMKSHGLRTVSDMVIRGFANDIRSIDFSGNPALTTDDACRVCSILPYAKQLEKLSFARCYNLGDDFCIHLTRFLPYCSNLTELDLCNCGLTDISMIELAPALASLKKLRRIDLSYNAIQDEGAAHLSAGLAEGASLEVLILSQNGIGKVGGECIGAALPSIPKLRELHLDGNCLEDGGFVGISAGLFTSSALTKVVVTQNGIGFQGAVALVNAASVHERFEREIRIELRENRINVTARTMLVELAPKNFVGYRSRQESESELSSIFRNVRFEKLEEGGSFWFGLYDLHIPNVSSIDFIVLSSWEEKDWARINNIEIITNPIEKIAKEIQMLRIQIGISWKGNINSQDNTGCFLRDERAYPRVVSGDEELSSKNSSMGCKSMANQSYILSIIDEEMILVVQFLEMPNIKSAEFPTIKAIDGTKDEGDEDGYPYDQSSNAQRMMKGEGNNNGKFTHISIPFSSASPMKGAYICLLGGLITTPLHLIFTFTSSKGEKMFKKYKFYEFDDVRWYFLPVDLPDVVRCEITGKGRYSKDFEIASLVFISREEISEEIKYREAREKLWSEAPVVKPEFVKEGDKDSWGIKSIPIPRDDPKLVDPSFSMVKCKNDSVSKESEEYDQSSIAQRMLKGEDYVELSHLSIPLPSPSPMKGAYIWKGRYSKDFEIASLVFISREEISEEIKYREAREKLWSEAPVVKPEFVKEGDKDSWGIKSIPIPRDDPKLVDPSFSMVKCKNDSVSKESEEYDQSSIAQRMLKGEDYVELSHLSIPLPSPSPMKGAYICMDEWQSPPSLLFTFTDCDGKKINKKYEFTRPKHRYEWHFLPIDLCNVVLCEIEGKGMWDQKNRRYFWIHSLVFTIFKETIAAERLSLLPWK
ncbi:hypothetical protein ADUPG1_014863 [Aduncisulcus paluster]|uniref:Uncharacterized protein n=1 Tax=Aduncisulcus paluster TaxID=2918883 RepID=A0ABQ5KEJ5_9EUKA|nr:hypothetical protein ADUPG1_014863 [Aduncisulcus paluster]